MPHLITRIVPDPHVYLKTDILADKPDFAIIVCQIFATWARIEHELNFLLIRVLGAHAAPAIAMFQTLTAQHLQLGALDAAAKAVLPPEDFEIFTAALSCANRTQTPRNHLAHWAWGGCRQRTDLMVLANPKMIRDRDFRVAKAVSAPIDPLELAVINLFNNSEVLAYSKADLERALRDLKECEEIIGNLAQFLDPAPMAHFASAIGKQMPPEEIRVQALARLHDKRLFREALDQIRRDRQSTPTPRPETPEQEPGGS